MRISYHKDTDSLYIHLSDETSVDSNEIAPNFVVDFDEKGNVVGLDIDLASRVVNIANVETNLPIARSESAGLRVGKAGKVKPSGAASKRRA